IKDRSSIGSHDPSRPKLFIFIGTSNFFPQRMKMESCKMFIGRLSWKTTEYREYFRVSVRIEPLAVLMALVSFSLLVPLFGTEVTAPPSKAIVLFMPVFAYPGYLSTPRHELASTLIQKQLQDSVTMRDRSEMAQLR
ncbi:unnamed protein product, partial [Brassica oleracea var. botrytis]